MDTTKLARDIVVISFIALCASIIFDVYIPPVLLITIVTRLIIVYIRGRA